MVTCGPAQVAVVYCVAAGGFLIASWGRTFVVEMVVGSSTGGAPGGLVTGHAYICWVSELKAVLAY